MTNPFFLTTPIYSSGTVTETLMVDAGTNLENVQFTIGYNGTEATFDAFSNEPSGWLFQPNTTTVGAATLGELGTTPVGVSADAAVATFTFSPVAGQPASTATVTVTDWGDEHGADNPGNIQLGTFVVCFEGDTKIATSSGETAVRSLRPGDRVLTADGRDSPVVWIGHRRIDCRRHPRPEQVWPVRIRAGAIAPNAPARDLWVSPNHAVLVGDALIPAKYLIDGAAVVQVATDTIDYFHVELPEHELILANGLAAESYLDVGDRTDFFGADGSFRLYPNLAALASGVAAIWEARGCGRLVVGGPGLDAARGLIAARAAKHRGETPDGSGQLEKAA